MKEERRRAKDEEKWEKGGKASEKSRNCWLEESNQKYYESVRVIE